MNQIEVDGDVLVDGNILALAQQTFPNGLWWIKDRVNSSQHDIVDSVRGGNLRLVNPSEAAEAAWSAPTGSSVAWCWNAGGASVANTDGSIETQVSANTDAGFSIFTYTGAGAGAAPSTLGHGLNQAPEWFMIRRRNGGPMGVYHEAIGAGSMLVLNTTAAGAANTNFWNNTAPTNDVITIGTSVDVNTDGAPYVCYAWHSVPNYSAIGAYYGNANDNGTYVNLNFRPAWLMIKQVSAAGNPWIIFDSTRATYNPMTSVLYPNTTGGEYSGADNAIDFVSNGFKIRNGNNTTNQLGHYYVYAAFSENPFGGSNTSPANAR